MSINVYLDKLHKGCARSPFIVRLCVKARNQAERVISCSLTDGSDPVNNGEYKLLAEIRQHCLTVIDVGANVGDWSAAFLSGDSRSGLQIVTFEPGISARAMLQARFASELRVIICPVAMGAAAGKAVLYENIKDSSSSSLAQVGEDPKLLNPYEVPVVTLDDEVRRLGWKQIDYLKIDAEGYDSHVLAGAEKLLSQQRIRFLQFEYNRMWLPAGATLKNVLQRMDRMAYHVFLVKKQGLESFDYTRYGEYFGYSNFFAVRHADLELVRNMMIRKA